MWKNQLAVCDSNVFNTFTGTNRSNVAMSHYRTRTSPIYDVWAPKKLFWWTAVQHLLDNPEKDLYHADVYFTILAFSKDVHDEISNNDGQTRDIITFCNIAADNYKEQKTSTTAVRIYNTNGVTNKAAEWISKLIPFLNDQGSIS